MDKGELVPDEIVLGMVEEALAKHQGKDIILDGFPRTRAQAEALDQILINNDLKVSRVVSIDVPEEGLIKRLTGRRICKSCGAVYHIEFRPTKEEGVCDACSGTLYQRNDDKENVIKK